MPLLDLETYSPIAMAFYCGAGLVWFAIYALVIRNSWITGFAPVPAFGITAFLAHEINWALFFPDDTGALFFWGSKAYAIFSAYILFLVLRQSEAYFSSAVLKRYAFQLIVASLISWLVRLYFLMPAIDDGAHMTTAVIVLVVFSVSYISLLVTQFHKHGGKTIRRMPLVLGLLKLIAASGMAVYVFVQLPDVHWVQVLNCLVILLDGFYIYLIFQLRRLYPLENTT